jgi:hypothetical protein
MYFFENKKNCHKTTATLKFLCHCVMQIKVAILLFDTNVILAENCERDSAVFVETLTLRSWAHLVAVFENFDKYNLEPFDRVVRKGFSGSARDSLLTIYQFATDSDGYFADVLYNSMAGLGTRDRTLIRVVVTRAEIDMGNIKVAFINKYLKTLETTIDVSTQKIIFFKISLFARRKKLCELPIFVPK